MDQSIKRRELVEKWRNSDKTIKPRQPGPMPKTFSHFATKEEWDQYRREVEQAQQAGAPF